MEAPLDSNIPLFRSLFKGRDDVFAIRWEKSNKSGYIPAYQYDPYLYRQHKMGGGTFQNFNAKNYLPLTDEQIAKHLNGGHLAGIYPQGRRIADFHQVFGGGPPQRGEKV
ncbi:MAG: hypothetical protein IPH12_03875 [Saprospirales bacterium]|nr:hypothetical protein [Saprospirales bacterium]MBK8922590.1 hypothetical protein [Saprospirales bacterium]